MTARDYRAAVDRQYIGRQVFSFDGVDQQLFISFQCLPGRLVVSIETTGVNQHMPHAQRIEAAVQMQLAVNHGKDLVTQRGKIIAEKFIAFAIGALIDADQNRGLIENDDVATLEQGTLGCPQQLRESNMVDTTCV